MQIRHQLLLLFVTLFFIIDSRGAEEITGERLPRIFIAGDSTAAAGNRVDKEGWLSSKGKATRYVIDPEGTLDEAGILINLSDITNQADGYGFDLGTPPNGDARPFYFSMSATDGNYRVTIELGDESQATNTSVKSETRRLMLKDIKTIPGEFVSRSFVVNVHELIREGDYLFIQFAHNDQKQEWPQTYVEAATTYKAYLKVLIAEARLRGVTPVLVTSVQRRRFDENGTIINSLEGYPQAMREVADEEQVALLDLEPMSRALYEALGVEKAPLAFN